MATRKPWSIVFGLAGLLLLLSWAPAMAQLQPSSAEIVRVTGSVETQRQGQTQWTPAAVGTRLVAGDHIRALSGGSAELALADGSTILVAENTRFVVTKLDYDPQTRQRDANFHLVVGKVRAQISRAAVQLVRARESNFNISTPLGVAAVRGSISVHAHTTGDPATGALPQSFVAVFPSPGQLPAEARLTWVNSTTGASVTMVGNQFSTQQAATGTPSAATPVSALPPAVQAALQTATNPFTLNSPALVAPTPQLVIVTPQDITTVLVRAGIIRPLPTGPPELPAPVVVLTPPTIGRDVQQTQCASPPCP